MSSTPTWSALELIWGKHGCTALTAALGSVLPVLDAYLFQQLIRLDGKSGAGGGESSSRTSLKPKAPRRTCAQGLPSLLLNEPPSPAAPPVFSSTICSRDQKTKYFRPPEEHLPGPHLSSRSSKLMTFTYGSNVCYIHKDQNAEWRRKCGVLLSFQNSKSCYSNGGARRQRGMWSRRQKTLSM